MKSIWDKQYCDPPRDYDVDLSMGAESYENYYLEYIIEKIDGVWQMSEYYSICSKIDYFFKSLKHDVASKRDDPIPKGP